MKEKIVFFLKTKKRSIIIILLFIFIILSTDSKLILYLCGKNPFDSSFDSFLFVIKIILSFILLMIIFLKYKKDNNLNEEKDVEIIMVEGEYGVGKSYHVQNKYVDKNKSKIINLYEESSEGNFLRDIYYGEFEIIINFIVVFLMLYSIYLSYFNEYYFIAILTSILFLQEYLMYIVNFFIKFLILENKYYLNVITNNFSKYDYIIFEDVDRLNFNEQRELIKIISYLKFHLKKGKKIILVGNVNYIDNIFIDKYITKKEKISKESHFKEWVDQLSKLKKYPKEEINLIDKVLHLFTERINYRFFKDFLNYLKEVEYKENLVNCFIEFYILFYLDVDINNPGLIKKIFDIYEIENIFGELDYGNYGESHLLLNFRTMIIDSKINLEFITFEFINYWDESKKILFKSIENKESKEKILKKDRTKKEPKESYINNTKKVVIYVMENKFNAAEEVLSNKIEEVYKEGYIERKYCYDIAKRLLEKGKNIDNVTDDEIKGAIIEFVDEKQTQ